MEQGEVLITMSEYYNLKQLQPQLQKASFQQIQLQDRLKKTQQQLIQKTQQTNSRNKIVKQLSKRAIKLAKKVMRSQDMLGQHEESWIISQKQLHENLQNLLKAKEQLQLERQRNNQLLKTYKEQLKQQDKAIDKMNKSLSDASKQRQQAQLKHTAQIKQLQANILSLKENLRSLQEIHQCELLKKEKTQKESAAREHVLKLQNQNLKKEIDQKSTFLLKAKKDLQVIQHQQENQTNLVKISVEEHNRLKTDLQAIQQKYIKLEQYHQQQSLQSSQPQLQTTEKTIDELSNQNSNLRNQIQIMKIDLMHSLQLIQDQKQSHELQKTNLESKLANLKNTNQMNFQLTKKIQILCSEIQRLKKLPNNASTKSSISQTENQANLKKLAQISQLNKKVKSQQLNPQQIPTQQHENKIAQK